VLGVIVLHRGERLSRRLKIVAGALALSAGVVFLASLAFGLQSVVESFVLYRVGPDWLLDLLYGHDGRVSLRTAFPPNPANNLKTLLVVLTFEGTGVVVIGVAGALALAVQRQIGWVGLVAWVCAQIAFLFMHTPLHDRHALSAVAPLAVVSAALVPALTWRGSPIARGANLILAVAGLTVYCLGAPSQLQRLIDDSRPRGPGGDLIEVAQMIAAGVPPDKFVFTDHNFAALLAHRMVPPPLTDVDNHRIQTKWLTSDMAIAAAEHYDVRAVVLWQPGVSYLERLPRVLEWLRAHFQVVWVGENQEILAVPRGATLDTWGRLGRSIDDLVFENGLSLYAVQVLDGSGAGAIRARLVWARTGAVRGAVTSQLALMPGDILATEGPIASSEQVLGRAWSPPETWQLGDVGAELHRIETPSALPAGRYGLYVGLKDSAGRAVRPASNAPPARQGLIEIAQVQIVR
jgi:hypothetical protein